MRMTLTGGLRDDITLRVDENARRPGARGVSLPGEQRRVVENRVANVVALHRRVKRVGIRLVHELRRVHAHHDELPAVLLLERAQLVEDVQAVHAAEGPEVQQQEASPQVRERELTTACVQPSTPLELRRTDARTGAHTTIVQDARPTTTGEPRLELPPSEVCLFLFSPGSAWLRPVQRL